MYTYLSFWYFLLLKKAGIYKGYFCLPKYFCKLNDFSLLQLLVLILVHGSSSGWSSDCLNVRLNICNGRTGTIRRIKKRRNFRIIFLCWFFMKRYWLIY